MLVLLAISSTVSAHCPSGGECFTRKDAADCVEAEQRYEKCESRLVKCNDKEAEVNTCRGKLNESRASNKAFQRSLRAMDRKVAIAKSDRASDEELWMFVTGSSAVTSTAVCVYACDSLKDMGVAAGTTAAVSIITKVGQTIF